MGTALSQGIGTARLPARVALATMHGKQQALAPAFAPLGVTLVLPEGFDSDRFGTFSGEIPRASTMQEAARAKLAAALQITGLSAGIASEGAYGPHPAAPVLAIGHEILLWRDLTTGQDLIEAMTDTTPVHDHVEVADMAGLAGFLARVAFPQTGLVVAPASAPQAPVAKGLRAHGALASALGLACARCPTGRALVQTDMRAFMNPRRMAIIAQLGDRLAARLARPCADCGLPGWGLIETLPGLPCSACGLKTAHVAALVHGCTACGSRQTLPRPDGRTMADPAHCAFCNP